jgi:hypothetical protein
MARQAHADQPSPMATARQADRDIISHSRRRKMLWRAKEHPEPQSNIELEVIGLA